MALLPVRVYEIPQTLRERSMVVKTIVEIDAADPAAAASAARVLYEGQGRTVYASEPVFDGVLPGAHIVLVAE